MRAKSLTQRLTKKLRSRSRGFSMVELLVATMVLTIAVLIGLPELRKFLVRMQVETFALNLSSAANKARYEAIKTGNEALVKANYADRRLFMFIDQPVFDVNGNRTDVPRVFDPTVDEFLFAMPLPDDVDFISPPGETVVAGLTDPVGADADEDHVAVFRSDGSLADAGSFRFGDSRSNYVQLSFNPQATGRVRTEKWDCDTGAWVDRAENWYWADRPLAGC